MQRLLIEGASGRGKSTLAALVAGLRTPAAGLVLVDGLDRRTLGAEGWRRVVVATPQFHENHVVSETFAFNLLMGRQWPPADADLDEAAEIVRELGLGDLLDRMPAGLLQLVGEGGWQLSHGERSRLFMARTLLQGGDADDPRRELRRARSRQSPRHARVRPAPGADPARDCPSLTREPDSPCPSRYLAGRR